MRLLVAAVAVALLLPAASANHVVYVDQSRVMSCLVAVQVLGVSAFLNCDPVVRTVAAAEPAGGSYRLTVDWVAAGNEWNQLHGELFSCVAACAPAGTGVCVNQICAGDPNGPQIVQQAVGTSGSPLVLNIPTAGNESNVTFTLKVPGPAFTSLNPQSVHFTLAHIG
jgi:hypothetical protein